MLDSTDRVKRKVFIISNMKFLVDQIYRVKNVLDKEREKSKNNDHLDNLNKWRKDRE